MQIENIFSANSKIKFPDLYNRDGLLELDQIFQEFFIFENYNLYQQFLQIKNFSKKEQSDLLIEISRILEDFLAKIFGIEAENKALQDRHGEFAKLYQIKRNFIIREIAKKYKADDVKNINGLELLNKIIGSFQNVSSAELALARLIEKYSSDENKFENELKEISLYCAFAIFHPLGIKFHQNGFLFKIPKKLDFANLVKLETVDNNNGQNGLAIKKIPDLKLHSRDGFKLTDQGFDLNQTLNEAHYCIYCHNQDKDSCSIGLMEKDNSFKKDPFGTELSGCPLEEKISEMNLLKKDGFSIAALAIAIIDNPMIAATGHRICNDCMKSCIYQKQDPVNIPQIESKVLKDVLNLPYGFEIYSLLTRWNPLNFNSKIVKADSGYKVLVAGLGPAGFTLAHYLLNEGHLVVAVDGLKIEPLDPAISGIDINGNRCEFKPIKNIDEIFEELDERPVYGFGGVAEYGITVRWDKNFLKVIRLTMERRANFQMFGGFRLGSGMDCFDALEEYKFDHVALCLGAGWPNIVNIKNNFLKGVRSASDFLMALQLTGAEKKNLLTNLQIRLPAVVVGSGLTAIDTACEVLAYYILQVEKFEERYEVLQKIGGGKNWNEEEKIIAQEFLTHASEIKKARENGENILDLLKKWGGVKLVYRKQISDSPAYRLNHEELEKAFEEGIEFVENATPLEAIPDQFNHIQALKVKIADKEIKIPAKSLLFAAGTSPNKAPFYEDKLKFNLDGKTFQIIDLLGNKLKALPSPKANGIGFIAAIKDSGQMVSFFGDLHPSFSGSVVKAMASAKNGYPIINDALKKLTAKFDYPEFLQKINKEFLVTVKEINILSENSIELIINCPALAQKTKLGHIFRLHNYHALALKKNSTLLAMEGVPVTAYKVDKEAGTVGVIVIDVGGSSSLVRNFKVGEPIIFMGPTGSPAHIHKNKTVILIGGARGNLPLASLGVEYKKNNCQVILFCGYKKSDQIAKLNELENGSDKLIISTEDLSRIKLNRPHDQLLQGKITDMVIDYLDKSDPENIDIIYTMGNEEMMHEIAKIKYQFREKLSETSIGIVSLNNPMQCMLKGVCSQCLQEKLDSKTGEIRYFYSCISQDQKMEEINFEFLKNRCSQNSLQEKLTRDWIAMINC